MAEAGIIFINNKINNKWEPIPIVVRTSMFSNLWYNPSGIISRFTYDYYNENGILESEEYISSTGKLNGDLGNGIWYYSRIDYQKYLAKEKKLSDVKQFDKGNFIHAEVGDNVKIWRQELLLSANSQCCRQYVKWQHDAVPIKLSTTFGDVIVPQMHTILPSERNCDVLDEGTDFFNVHSLRLYNQDIISNGNEDYIHRLIASISNLIDMIGKEIFNAYNSENPYLQFSINLFPFSLSDAIDQQIGNFGSVVYTLNTIEDFEKYYSNLYSYYNKILNELYIIENGSELEKVVNLLLTLHSNILVKITVDRRLEILKFLVDEKLETATEETLRSTVDILEYAIVPFLTPVVDSSNEENKIKLYEELVVKLCLAFDSSHLLLHSNDNSHIDYFLNGLLKEIYYTDYGLYKSENVTLYEALYNRMSTSWNLTENIIHLSNWVFDTKYKPNHSKGAFVQAVYGLWIFSKYNPYDQTTSNLEPNKIGFKKIPNAFARDKYGDYILDENGNKKQAVEFNYDPNLPQNQTLFKYTHEVGYYKKNHKNIFGEYQEDRYDHFNEPYAEDCSPLIITYESNKSLGVFKNNFNFEFKGNKILANINKLYTTVSGLGEVQSVERIYGKYDIFQPIALISPEKITDSKVSVLSEDGNEVNIEGNNINSFTPVFVLKYIDDANDRDAAETMIGYSVDIVLTFTGVGNLSKLRYLRYGTGVAEGVGLFTRQGLSIVIGALDFTAGVLGFLDALVDCDPNSTNYEFCKSVKGFVQVLQIVSLSATSVDSLQLVMLRIKAKKVSIAAGSNSSEVQEIKQAIEARFNQMSNDAVNSSKAAENIAYMSIIPISPQVIKNIRIKITNRINASTFKLQASYTDSVLQDFITLCKQDLAQTEKFIVDMVFIAQRKGKRINPQELTKQAKWYVHEISLRGFGAGFSNLNMYKQFCNNFKNKFIQNLDELQGGLADFFVEADFIVQGSAARTWKNGDPAPLGNNLNFKPSKQADDIDVGIAIEPHLYDGFRIELKHALNKIISNTESTTIKKQLEEVIDKINSSPNKLLYFDVFEAIPNGSSQFVDELRNACKDFTNFSEDYINFAVIKKYSNADNLPNVPFKY